MKQVVLGLIALMVLSVNGALWAQASDAPRPDGNLPSPAAVKIERQWFEQQGGALTQMTTNGLGAFIAPNLILTHNHFHTPTQRPVDETVEFLTRDGQRFGFPAAAVQFIPIAHDTALIKLPDNLANFSVPLADKATIRALHPSNWLSLTYWDDEHHQLAQQSFQIISVRADVITLADPNCVINPGDSGGGVTFQGKLVGHVSSRNVDRAGQPTGSFNVELLPPEIAN